MDSFINKSSPIHKTDLEQRSSYKETNENAQESHHHNHQLQNMKRLGTKHFMSPTISAASKSVIPRKKVLVERNEASGMSFTDSPIRTSHPSSDLGHHGSPDLGSESYDPLTNYLSPRPRFLRYNPNKRAEILSRREIEMRKTGGDWLKFSESNKLGEEDPSSNASDSLPSSPSSQERSIKQEDVPSLSESSDCDDDGEEEGEEEVEEKEDDDEEEEGEEKEGGYWNLNGVFKCLLLLGVLFLSTSYICCMNTPTASPSLQNMWGLQERYPNIQNHVFKASANILSVGSAYLDRNEEKGVNLMEERLRVISEEVEKPGEASESSDTGMGNGKPSISETYVKSDSFPEMAEAELVSGEDQVRDEAIRLLPLELEANSGGIGKEEMIEQELELVDVIGEWAGQDVETEAVPSSSEVRIGDEPIPVVSWEMDEVSLKEDSNEGTEKEEMIEQEPDKVVDVLVEGVEKNMEESESINNSDCNIIPESPEIEVDSELGHVTDTFVNSLVFIATICLVLRFICRKATKASVKTISPTTEAPLETTDVEDRGLSSDSKEEGTEEERIEKAYSYFNPPSSVYSEEPIARYSYFNPSNSVHSEEQIVKAESYCSPSSSVHSDGIDSRQLYQSHAPTVELLGEYVVVRGGGLQSSSQSQEKKKRTRRKVMSPAANHQDYQSGSEFSGTESHSYGRVTLKEKMVIKEEGEGGEEVTKVVTTPVRRSSRIRSRAMSP